MRKGLILILLLCLTLGACSKTPEAPAEPDRVSLPQAEAEPVEPEAIPFEVTIIYDEGTMEAGPAPEIPPPPRESLDGEDDPSLDQQLEEALAQAPGQWSLYWEDLTTGETIHLDDSPMVAASLIKLFVAGAYLEAVEAGTLEDSWANDLDLMLSQSSNESCNRLIDLLGSGDTAAGMEAVNSFAARMGCIQSQLQRKMLQQSEKENYTSTQDCAAFLKALTEGRVVSPEASQRILDALLAQTRRGKLPAGLPEGTRCANKTGELLNVENDAALIWDGDRIYVLCIMSNDLPDTDAARTLITQLSAMIWEAGRD